MGYAEIAAGQRCSVQGSEVSIGQHGGVLDLCSPWTARRLVVRRVYETAAQAPRALYAAASKNNVVPAGRWRSGGGDLMLVSAPESRRGPQLRLGGAPQGGGFFGVGGPISGPDFFRGHAARLQASPSDPL